MAGALHLAVILLGETASMPSRGQLQWFNALCFEREAVESISHSIMDGLSAEN